MRKPYLSHPEDEQLLRYADGELPAGAAGRIRAHLEACWQCRAELEDLQNTVGQCVRYRKNVLQRHLPTPPAPWTDIYRRFAEVDSELARAGLRDRLARLLQGPLRHTARWAPAAVAVMVVCVLFYRFRQTPSVEAAELLRKAVAAEDARPQKPRRIEIRTKDRRLTRLTGADPVAALFIAAHYDWQDPLSARSYQAWRDQLPGKQEEVVEEPGGYRIRTGASSGELATATLKIRTVDFRPVEERLEFRNREWVEITELPDDAAPSPDTLVAAAGSNSGAIARTTPALPASVIPGAAVSAVSATPGDELRVLAALHRVGADLGDPVEVSRTGSEIVVTGVGIAPLRQQEIHDALSSEQRVVVRFSEPTPPRVEPEKDSSPDTAIDSDVQQLQARMAAHIGGHEYFVELASQVLDLSEPMMARAYALRRLAERIPAGVESDLAPQDRQLLEDLRREHTAELRRQIAEIDHVLKPALAPLNSPLAAAPAVVFSGPWQPATEALFQTARRVDKLLAVTFGAAPLESAAEPLASQLLSSLAQLRASLEAYDRLPPPSLERSIK